MLQDYHHPFNFCAIQALIVLFSQYAQRKGRLLIHLESLVIDSHFVSSLECSLGYFHLCWSISLLNYYSYYNLHQPYNLVLNYIIYCIPRDFLHVFPLLLDCIFPNGKTLSNHYILQRRSLSIRHTIFQLIEHLICLKLCYNKIWT